MIPNRYPQLNRGVHFFLEKSNAKNRDLPSDEPCMWQTCGTSRANISQITSPYANTSTLSVRGPASFISILCHGSDPMYECFGFRGPVRSSFKKMDTPKSHTFTNSKSPFTWIIKQKCSRYRILKFTLLKLEKYLGK